MASISHRPIPENHFGDEVGALWCDKCQTLMPLTKESYEIQLKQDPTFKRMAIIHQYPICMMKVGTVVIKYRQPRNPWIRYNKIN